MYDIQNKEEFINNLTYHNSEWSDLISKSKFYFTDLGMFAFYYDRNPSSQWNKKAMKVVVESDSQTLEKWKKVNQDNPGLLKTEFTDALSPNSDYQVVDEQFNLSEQSSAFLMQDELQDNINKISTRNDDFSLRPVDEKIQLLNNTIENMLKRSGKFISINDDEYFKLLTNENIREFRNKTQSFRHASEESIHERELLTRLQKEFLVNYGTMIVITLSSSQS